MLVLNACRCQEEKGCQLDIITIDLLYWKYITICAVAACFHQQQ